VRQRLREFPIRVEHLQVIVGFVISNAHAHSPHLAPEEVVPHLH
jgi:hypothetical protein